MGGILPHGKTIQRKEGIRMNYEKLLEKFKNTVVEYANGYAESRHDAKPITSKDVYVVWSCKTLQNYKALLSTPRPDSMYYELTYNGDEKEFYFDGYKKIVNVPIKYEEEGTNECSTCNRETDKKSRSSL